VNGAGSDCWRARGAAQPGSVGHHRHVPARRPGAGVAGDDPGHGRDCGEEAADLGSPGGREPAVKREWSALIFAMTFPTLMTWFYFVVLARPISLTPIESASRSPGNPGAQAAYTLGKVIQFSFPLLFVVIFEPSRLRPGRPNFKGIGLGIGFGLLVGAGMAALYLAGLQSWLAGTGAATMIRIKIEEFNADSPLRYAVFASFMAVAHTFYEVYYWRCCVF